MSVYEVVTLLVSIAGLYLAYRKCNCRGTKKPDKTQKNSRPRSR